MVAACVLETNLEGFKVFRKGKVRDVYDLGEHLLLIASDRVSAYDVVIPTGIPFKGQVLTQISKFWFDRFAGIVPGHLVSVDVKAIIAQYPDLAPYESVLANRTMLVKKTEVVPMECVVRGYLSGSGWKEYQASQSVCGIALPAGLQESDALSEPIFTPATKEDEGHDINISEQIMAETVGKELTAKLKAMSLEIYTAARAFAREKGIIIADTKFEFGLLNGEPILIDEVLTPDSSRFWPLEDYQPGRGQASFDKQFVRDYVSSVGWNKQPPAPELPEDIVEKTSQKYLQALKVLTGQSLET